MAGTGDIKQKIVLEGEKEYSAALKEAQRNLKVLRSELKAETAELGKNAKEQEKNATKAKYLKQQIAEQEKIVRTYEKALEEVKKKYGDNEDAIARWEVKLNDARTALANMRGTLEDTGKSLQTVGDSAAMSTVAANSLAESLSKVASAGGAISGAIETAFTGITGMIADTVSAVWESVVDLAARSNNLVDLAGFWNTDVLTIQKYAGAVANVSGNLEDLNSIVTKVNSLDEQKIAELTGVSKNGYDDQWKYAMAVMDAMSKMSTSQRNAAGFELFGKGATKAFDLLNDWATLQQHLDEFDPSKGGYGLSEEQMQSMSELYDKVNGLKASWQALQDMATVDLFGNLALNVTGDLQTIVDAFKEYFNAEDEAERAAAIEKVKAGILSLFEHVRDAMQEGIALLTQLAEEFKQSDDPVVRAIGDAFEAVKNVLEWFANPDNWSAIENGFKAIIGIWAAGKVTSAIGNLASFASHIATIKGFSGGNTPTVTPTESGGGGSTVAGAAGGGAAAKLLTSTGAKIAGGSVAFLTTLFGDLLRPADPHRGEASEIEVNTSGPVVLAETEAPYADLGPSGLPGYHADRRPKQSIYDMFHEEEEDVLLDALTREKAVGAIQDWWDAWRANDQNPSDENAFEEENALEWMKEALGDNWGDVYDRIIEKLDETDQEGLEDIPEGWYSDMLDSMDFGQETNGELKKSIDGLNKLPEQIENASARGTAKGINGISVQLDGYAVGSLIAPYVSTFVARDLIT